MTPDDRFLPYPELVEPLAGVPYRIADSEGRPTTGAVDKLRRLLWVPLNATGRAVARHELAHVLWSPPHLPRVRHPLVVLQAVEDARINLGLAQLGVAVDLDPEQRIHVQWLGLNDLAQGRAGDFLMRWVASLGTSAETMLAQAAEGAGERGAFAAALVCEVRQHLERQRRAGPVAPFVAARAAARKLARRLRALGVLDPAFRELSPRVACCAVEGAEDDPDHRHPPDATGGDGELEGSDGLGSGHLEVVEALLSEPHPAARRLRRGWRASTEGARLGALHRWATDRAVFRRPARRLGGSVLIDTSGSMSLDSRDVDAILAASRGAALVAIYSGRREKGQLRVVARAGRRAARDQLERFGGGNVVDAPALSWLGRQSAPRIWVSDGGVTGIGDRSSRRLRERCDELCRHHRIRRFGSPDLAAQALARGRVA